MSCDQVKCIQSYHSFVFFIWFFLFLYFVFKCFISFKFSLEFVCFNAVSIGFNITFIIPMFLLLYEGDFSAAGSKTTFEAANSHSHVDLPASVNKWIIRPHAYVLTD